MYFKTFQYKLLFLLISITTFGQTINFEINGDGPPTVVLGSVVQINAVVTPANPNYVYTWDNITTGNTIQTGPSSFFNEIILERTTYRVRVSDGTNRFESFITISVIDPLNPGFDGLLQVCNQSGTIDLFTILEGNPDPGGTWIPPLSGGNGNFVIGVDPIQNYIYRLDPIDPFPNVRAESIVIIKDCRDQDSDGDGVLDDVDLDDDNDGILDTVENEVCSPDSLVEIDSILDFSFGEGFTPTTYMNVLDHEFSGIWPDDGFYCVGTSSFFGSVPQANGSPATFVMTNTNNNEDADGNTNGRYLAININSNLIDNPIFEIKDIPVEAGEQYRFRIDMAGLCDGCQQVPILNLEIIDQNLPAGSPPIFSTTSADIGIENNDIWNRVPLTFQAVNTTLLSLVIRNFQTDGNNGNDLGIDNIKFTPLACDFDRDEIPNYLDLDSDNDGIFDIIEAGNLAVIDANNDGIADGPVDANGVPVSANGGTTLPINTDNLEFPNYLDIDADNDGIQDNIEAQTTANYIAPSGNDLDTNGVDDTYDVTILLPIDTDADGIADYLDLNSDNDCLVDNIEAYDFNQDGIADIVPSGLDTDFDGLDDNYDEVILNLINSVTNPTDNNEVPTDLPDNNAPGNDVDFRDEYIFADPGIDASIESCSIDDPIDLFDVLGGTPEPGGTWSPTLASGTSIFNPAIDPAGVYTYTIDSVSTCPDVSAQVTITINDPFDLSTCNVIDTTIECDGDLNETIADKWHQDNLDELATCIDDPNVVVTDNYDFTTITTTCGAGGTITVTYRITDECGIPSSITATLTLEDSIPPVFDACDEVTDQSIECTSSDNETVADQWNKDNIDALTNCATDECNDAADYVVTSDYDFGNLDTDGACGAGGTLTVNYTVADDCGNAAPLTVILTLEDTTGPELITDLESILDVVCSEVPEVPELEFIDGCTDEDIIIEFEEVISDLGDGSDYQLIRTWTVTDICNNTEVYTQTINVGNETLLNQVSREVCYDDGSVNLFTFLPTNTDTTGEWIIVSAANASIELIDGVFDPSELDQEEDLGDYVFSYTVTKGFCLENTEVTITLNGDCIVLPCGLDDFTVSKALTPNGDEYNQFFEVASVKDCGFIINIKIFNRYGAIVYQNEDYQNDWSANSHSSSIGGATQLPNGTYYYVIILEGSGFKPLSGPLFIGTK